MVKRTLRICLATGLILSLLSGSVIAATGTVTGSSVRLRNGASSDSAAITSASKGEQVEVIGEEGDWYQVVFEGTTGYMSKEYIETDYSSSQPETPTETTTEPEPTTGEIPATDTPSDTTEEPTEEPSTVTFAKNTNLRYLPNFTSRVKAVAQEGATYTVRGSLNNWVKVSNESNSGWVLKSAIEGTLEENAVSVPETPQTPTEPEAPQEPVEDLAKGRVIVESARVRETPNGEILGSLPNGTEVVILSENDGWYEINTMEYGECYIAERLITEL